MTALTTTNNDGATLLTIIQQAATQPDFDVAKMQQLMELKREWDRDRGGGSLRCRYLRVPAEVPADSQGAQAHVGTERTPTRATTT
jgi:hypothetical protein